MYSDTIFVISLSFYIPKVYLKWYTEMGKKNRLTEVSMWNGLFLCYLLIIVFLYVLTVKTTFVHFCILIFKISKYFSSPTVSGLWLTYRWKTQRIYYFWGLKNDTLLQCALIIQEKSNLFYAYLLHVQREIISLFFF